MEGNTVEKRKARRNFDVRQLKGKDEELLKDSGMGIQWGILTISLLMATSKRARPETMTNLLLTSAKKPKAFISGALRA